MSSESNFIASLNLAITNLFKFGGPILTSLGTVSCILSLAVFTKKNLRKNPCSIYFIAYNIVSLIFMYTLILPQTLAKGYKIDPTVYNLAFCRFRLYATLLADVVGPSYLILASVDRVLITSRNARTRQRSTVRLAYSCITCVTLFWLLAVSHTLVLGRIIPIAPGINLCYFQLGNYYAFISYYSVIVKGILVPLLMLIFGLWAIKNVRDLGHVAPASVTAANGSTRNAGLPAIRSKDRQLLQIVIADISIYLIFTLMMSVVLTYQQIVPDSSQNAVDTQLRIFLVTVGAFGCYIPSCIGFYNNLFASKTFRHEAKGVVMCK